MKKTPLFESHKNQSARFISFAGWTMPFSYSNSREEHLQVRQTGGLFDVCHMGQIRIKGQDSLPFLEKLLPSRISSLKAGQALYSVLCLPTGGLIDDLIIYCISKEEYFLCVNSAFKDKDLQWIQSQNEKNSLKIQDESEVWGMIAVQGAHSFDLCEKVFPSVSFKDISRFHFQSAEGCLLSRTGYTGEQGFELYTPIEKTLFVWEKLIEGGREFSISPIGLGARDTLRLEMAYLLSGQDFNESKTVLQAGLNWVLTNDQDYIGKTALLKQKEEGAYSRLTALVLEEGSAIPRAGYPLYDSSGKQVGEITSGAKSPSLNQIIALAYVEGESKSLLMSARGSQFKAEPIKKPFIKEKKLLIKDDKKIFLR